MTPCHSLAFTGSRQELGCEVTHQRFDALLRHLRQPGREVACICNRLDVVGSSA